MVKFTVGDQAGDESRRARAEARRAVMTIEVVQLGERKPLPYANSSAEERLAAVDHA